MIIMVYSTDPRVQGAGHMYLPRKAKLYKFCGWTGSRWRWEPERSDGGGIERRVLGKTTVIGKH